jgi:hypothetical protein
MDMNGQLLSGSLMDYALPTASNIPAMQIVRQRSPSPLNPLGVKGVGEGGAVAPPGAVPLGRQVLLEGRAQRRVRLPAGSYGYGVPSFRT